MSRVALVPNNGTNIADIEKLKKDVAENIKKGIKHCMEKDTEKDTKSCFTNKFLHSCNYVYMLTKSYFTNKFWYSCNFVYMLLLAALNFGFVWRSVFMLHRDHDDVGKAEKRLGAYLLREDKIPEVWPQIVLPWDSVEFIVAWSEALVVTFHLTIAAVDWFIALCMIDRAPAHAYEVAYSVESAASFSFLIVLPLPSKVAYWYSNRKLYADRYCFNPPGTCMHWEEDDRQFYPWKAYDWTSLFKNLNNSGSHCFSSLSETPKVLRVCVVFAWLVVRAKPLFIGIGIFLSPAAAILKIFNMNQGLRKSSGLSYWILVLGLLNQMSKMWDPKAIAMNGFVKHLDACRLLNKSQGNKLTKRSRRGRKFMQQMTEAIWDAFHDQDLDMQFPAWQAVAFLASFDVGEVGKVLNGGSPAEYPPSLIDHLEGNFWF